MTRKKRLKDSRSTQFIAMFARSDISKACVTSASRALLLICVPIVRQAMTTSTLSSRSRSLARALTSKNFFSFLKFSAHTTEAQNSLAWNILTKDLPTRLQAANKLRLSSMKKWLSPWITDHFHAYLILQIAKKSLRVRLKCICTYQMKTCWAKSMMTIIALTQSCLSNCPWMTRVLAAAAVTLTNSFPEKITCANLQQAVINK